MTRNTPIGRLQPGDEVYRKRGRRIERLGVVVSAEKNVRLRHVTVTLTTENGRYSFSSNWATHLLVKVPA